MRRFSIMLLLLVLLHASHGLANEKPSMAILPFNGIGNIEKRVLKMLSDIFTVEVGNIGTYKVISSDEVNALLGAEKMKSALGCDELSCAQEIGGALGTAYLMYGSIGVLGDKLNIKITLFDNKKAVVLKRIRVSVINDENRFEKAVMDCVAKLFSNSYIHPMSKVRAKRRIAGTILTIIGSASAAAAIAGLIGWNFKDDFMGMWISASVGTLIFVPIGIVLLAKNKKPKKNKKTSSFLVSPVFGRKYGGLGVSIVY